MSDGRSQMMVDVLTGIQRDVGTVKRDLISLGRRLGTLDEQAGALLAAISERRLGLADTEH